jgi:hypothetical protein
MAEKLPDLLTVEEAARFARVGRTKAYSMAREWRATGGRSGLPVIDLGHVLRVPRRALEEMIGAELTASLRAGPAKSARNGDEREPVPAPTSAEPPPRAATSKPRAPSTRRSRRPKNTTRNQLHLFDSTD